MTDPSQSVQIIEKRTATAALTKPTRASKGQPRALRRHFDEETVARVRKAARVGLTARSIGHLIGTDFETVERHFGEIIEEEQSFTEELIAGKLASMAADGKLGAATYWLDRRGKGWHQQQAPATNAVQVVVNLSNTLRQAMSSLEGVKRTDSTENGTPQLVASKGDKA